MKNILKNSETLFKNLLPGNRLTQDEVKNLQNFYLEIISQSSKISAEFKGISEWDLTTSESEIKKIINS